MPGVCAMPSPYQPDANRRSWGGGEGRTLHHAPGMSSHLTENVFHWTLSTPNCPPSIKNCWQSCYLLCARLLFLVLLLLSLTFSFRLLVVVFFIRNTQMTNLHSVLVARSLAHF